MSGNSDTPRMIAVIIAAYRAEKYINQCVASVLAQKLPPGWSLDVRVGVDGCPDTERAMKYPYFRSDRNVGAYIMRNSLIYAGKADAYTFFDADDVMIQGFFARILPFLGDFGAVLPGKYMCNADLSGPRYRLQDGGSLTFTHSALEKIGGFRSFRCACDSDFMRRLELSGVKIYKIKEPLYYRRIHSGSLTQKSDTGYRSDYRRRVWREMTEDRERGKLIIKPETVPIFFIDDIDKKRDIQNMTMPVYILIRTSNRPNFFTAMMASIRAQTYPNIITIVHTDNPADTYVEGDIILRGDPFPDDLGRAPYNLYCNRLLDSIPDWPGWFMFLDDDDALHAPDTIERLVAASKHDYINVARVIRWNNEVFPKDFGSCHSFQTECFMIHTDYKSLGRWWANRGGDHYYTRQITDKLPTNWIHDLIIARAQEGKGHGRRYDAGDAPRAIRPNELVPVVYRYRVRIPSECRGMPGDIKTIPYRIALDLQQRGKVEIKNYSDFVETTVARA